MFWPLSFQNAALFRGRVLYSPVRGISASTLSRTLASPSIRAIGTDAGEALACILFYNKQKKLNLGSIVSQLFLLRRIGRFPNAISSFGDEPL